MQHLTRRRSAARPQPGLGGIGTGGRRPRRGDYIHLGALRVPGYRRITWYRAGASEPENGGGGGGGTAGAVAAVEIDEEMEREIGGDSEGWERDGRRFEEERRIDPYREANPLELGSPSLVPFGLGREKTEEVVQVPVSFSVEQTIHFIRDVAKADRNWLQHTHDRVYVTDQGQFAGVASMAALLTNQPEVSMGVVMRNAEEVLREGDSWEQAAHRLRNANVMAAPVVDEDGYLVAVLNPSDLLKEMEIEATDDVMRLSGSGGGESYFGTPLPRLVASRVGWLVSLLLLQSLSSVILTYYQSVIERNIVIALFLTMLTGTAGNAGNQSSAMVIRGLATGEIHRRNAGRVIAREAKAAVMAAAVLSAASFARVFLTPGSTMLATLAVSIAMGATVVGAVMFGTVAPIVLDRLGVDPVNFASPALATLTDVSGVFILCSVASLLLRSGGGGAAAAGVAAAAAAAGR